MIRSVVKVLVVAAMCAAFDAGRADAFWGHSHGSSGSHGGWGSSGSWGSHGSGGSHGGWGWNRHRYQGYYGYGSYGSWGSSYGSYAYTSNYGSYGGAAYSGYGSGMSYGSYGGSGYGSYGGSYGSYGGGAVYSDGGYSPAQGGMPVQGGDAGGPPPAVDGAPMPPAPGTGANAVGRDGVLLTVQVPADAKVFVNDNLTRSNGSDRRFLSRGLEAGREYSYNLRAEIVRDGQTLTQTRSLKLQAGQVSNVQFDFADAPEIASQPMRTALIVRVPADAKVFLSGKPTSSTGEVREFATTKLTAGDQWADYAVRVELERNGRTLTSEKNVSIQGGQTREVAFDFETPEVAARAAN